jgi:glycerophosphoryl diester phosphodiesterase
MSVFDSWLVNKYIAHRGLHNKDFPENSLPAFENAIKHNYAIEIDVQMTKDNTVIVFHDDNLKRVTGKDIDASALQDAELEDCFLEQSQHKIPTLEQTLDLIAGKVPILIEIKNSGKIGKLEKAVLKILEGYSGEIAVQSFNPFTLNFFYTNAPQILRGQLSGTFKDSKLSRLKKYFLRNMCFNKKVSKPNFIAYEADILPNHATKKFKHLPLIAWCVKSQNEYLDVIKYCDNIIFENFLPKI